MLYRFLKFILGFAIRTYFREIELRNDDRIPAEGPAIFLPNHRSAFMDPIVVAAYLKRRVHFLARGESFKNPIVAKILKMLNVIPIYRKDHSPDDMHKNEEIFKYCFQLLEENGVLVIFPEGASQSKPVLLPLKTGAARIALGAEAKNNFELGVHLIPVGINYTNPHHFQGKLFLNFGKPILVCDFKDAYLKNSIQAVQNLTGFIEDELKRRIVVADNSRWTDLTEKVELIVQSDPKRFGVGNNPDNVGWFLARKDITGAIDYFRNVKIEILEDLEIRVQQYFSILDLLNLNEGVLNPLGKKQEGNLRTIPLFIYFILGLPFFLIGFIIHFLPFYFTRSMAKMVVKRTDFTGSVTLVAGLILFSIFDFTLIWIVFKYWKSYLIALLLLFILPPLGFFTFQYFIRFKRWASAVRIKSIGNRKSNLIEHLKTEREALLKVFESAHKDYLAYEKRKT